MKISFMGILHVADVGRVDVSLLSKIFETTRNPNISAFSEGFLVRYNLEDEGGAYSIPPHFEPSSSFVESTQ
jgi:hypothetical protein